MTTGAAEAAAPDLRIARGGPFYELQERLGLLHESALNVGRRALLAVAVAWAVPLVLALAAGSAWSSSAGRPYLLDLGTWARFFVAVGVLVLSERLVEGRLRGIQAQLLGAPLLAPESRGDAAAAVLRALRRCDSRIPELVILGLAFLLPMAGAELKLAGDPPGWLAWTATDGARHLTVAGWWCLLVSAPLFWFLLLRWLWRHLVWGLLLRDVANLRLRLVATHPDGYGGLAFIGEYPNAFAAFVLATTCVVAAEALQALQHGTLRVSGFSTAISAWVAIVVLLFAVPLAAFGKPLKRLKRETLLALSTAGTRHEREQERKLLGRNIAAPAEAESPPLGGEPAPGGDPGKAYALARKLGTVPVTKAALLPLGVAAVLPLLAVGTTQLPFRELLKAAKLLLL